MRPVYLKMSAFGPFADVAEIDFTLLGTEGVYLLAGETGAGKTTVFDAITFALFGQCSGEARKPEDLRSDYAGPETQTYVDLTFELRGKRYRVKRDPGGYQRAKRRGEGTTTCLSESVLELPDGTQLSGKRVTEKITELLGIDANQFGQIVMLAQGDFEKLLTEGTKERTAIFRKIFGTAMYQRFQDELVDERKQLGELCQQGAHEVEILAKQALSCMGDADEPRGRLEDWLGRDALQAGNVLEALRDEQTLLDARHDEASQALDRTQQARDEAARKLDRARQADAARDEAAQAQLALSRIDARIPELEEREQSCSQACGEVPGLQQRAGALREQLPSYAAHEAAERQKAQAKSSEAAAKAALAESQARQAQAENEVSRLEEDVQALAGAREALAKADADVAARQRDLDATQALADAAAQAKACDEEAATAQARLTKADGYLAGLDKADSNDAEALAKQAARENELADAPEKLSRARLEAQAARTELDATRVLVRSLEGLEADLARKQEAHCRAAEHYQVAADASSQRAGALADLRRAYEDGLAGVLAAGLAEGAPCPVCGSLSHPRPAQASQATPSKEAVEQAQTAAEQARAQASALCGEAKAACELAQAAQDALDAFAQENGDKPTLEARVSHLCEQAAQLDSQTTRLESDVAALQRCRQEQARLLEQQSTRARKRQEAHDLLAGIREQLATAKATRQSALDAIARAGHTPDEVGTLLQAAQDALHAAGLAQQACAHRVRDLESAQAGLEAARQRQQDAQARAREAQAAHEQAVQQLKVAEERARASAERLEYPDEAAARAELAALETRVTGLTRDLEQAQARLQESRTERARAASALETLQHRLDELGRHDSTQASQALAHADEEFACAQKAERATGQALATLARLTASLEGLAAKDADLQARYARLERLSRVADGTMQGTERLTFETFVQMRYFEVVLAAANTRLSEMTQGQYELVRCERAEGGSAKVGLNVDVLDNFTGKARSAKSLSGGEKFMASLALALGLSEVVQRQSGGIQLDTMFVDEGFGSLDQEKLRLVMRAMARPGASGKLVGIISHVEELMGTIDRKIVVERTRTGSKLHVEV